MKGIHIHHIRTLWRKRRGETKEETKDIKKERKTNERKREREEGRDIMRFIRTD